MTSNERPHTCEVELAISSRMIHRTRTKGSAERARESAWDGVCTTLRHQHDIDCRDPDRVTVVSDAPRRPKDGNDESRQYYDHELVLTVLRVATGVGEAPGDRSEACHHARAHACEQLVGGPCPETGMHVISVDGKPSNAAAGEPAPKASPVI